MEDIRTEEDSNVEPFVEEKGVLDISPNQVAIVKGRELYPELSNNFNQIGSRLYPVAKTVQLTPGLTSDFTDYNHNHANNAGGGQLNPSTALSSEVPVIKGGTGAATLTGILKGNGTSAVTAIVPLAGTKQYYVADSSGGAVTRRLTFTDGVLTSES